MDSKGRLVTTIKDISAAIEILFDSIILKRDDLDSSTRQFYNELKLYAKNRSTENGKSVKFLQREVREHLNRSKTNTSKYLRALVELEYLQATGNANKGYVYEVVYDADLDKVRKEVMESLHDQIMKLETLGDANGTLEV